MDHPPDRPDTAPDLGALIGSRICHDLVNPLGAIGNGVELLAMTGTAGPEVALIADAVAQANARIRLFRLAFGAAAADRRIGRPEVLGLLADLTRGGRISAGWSSAADLARAEVRLALLGFMICESAMPWGGRIAVAQEGAAWRVEGTAPRLRLDEAAWARLQGPGEAGLTPAQVQFALLAEGAARMGRRLTVERAEGRVGLEF